MRSHVFILLGFLELFLLSFLVIPTLLSHNIKFSHLSFQDIFAFSCRVSQAILIASKVLYVFSTNPQTALVSLCNIFLLRRFPISQFSEVSTFSKITLIFCVNFFA